MPAVDGFYYIVRSFRSLLSAWIWMGTYTLQDCE